jgi:hypothetical protein
MKRFGLGAKEIRALADPDSNRYAAERGAPTLAKNAAESGQKRAPRIRHETREPNPRSKKATPCRRAPPRLLTKSNARQSVAGRQLLDWLAWTH